MPREISDFERGWKACPIGHALRQERRWEYDARSGLLYAPASFAFNPVNLSIEPPADDWIRQNLVAFVRGEFSERLESAPPFPGMPIVLPSKEGHEDAGHQYLANAEKLVYSGYLGGLLEAAPDSFGHQLHAILADKRIGNPKNGKFLSPELVEDWFSPLMIGKLRARFVMPAFPFKDQNPFRTLSRPSSPDMAEVAMLVHLHLVTQALYQIHPHGADWVLLCDGIVYSDVFGVEPADALEYQSRLIQWRDWLNLSRTVSIVDLADLLTRCDTTASNRKQDDLSVFDQTRVHIEERITAALEEDEPEVVRCFRVLKRGMAWNMNTRALLKDHGPQDLWDALKMAGHPTAEAEGGLSGDINELSARAALKYSSLNLTLKFHDVIHRFIPDSLRATIHPKPGQVAAPRVGDSDAYPWNCVAMLSGQELEPGALSLDALHSFGARHSAVQPVLDRDTRDPLFFVSAQ